jgi:hypothetical protein
LETIKSFMFLQKSPFLVLFFTYPNKPTPLPFSLADCTSGYVWPARVASFILIPILMCYYKYMSFYSCSKKNTL